MGDGERVIAGRYRLTHRLGSGGMGVVWHAVDERLHRPVAVKELRLPPHLTGDEAEQAKLRAMRESRIAARIQHPHVIAVYDVVEDTGHPCLVMEYLPSKSLSEVLAERGTLPPIEVAHLGTQAARALEAAHVAGVVHRDVKPGNVLLADAGTAKIADFGISRAAGDVTLTATGLISGTPAYLAPEVAKGQNATTASDVFSLGATLYTAVEGAPPFGLHDNPIALLHHIATGDLTPPRLAGPLTDVLLDMLAREPERRPTMRAVGDRLAAVAAGRAPSSPGPARPVVGGGVASGGEPGAGAAASGQPSYTSTLPVPPSDGHGEAPTPPQPVGDAAAAGPSDGQAAEPSYESMQGTEPDSGPPESVFSSMLSAPSGGAGPTASHDLPSRRGVWAVMGLAIALVAGGIVAAIVLTQGPGDSGTRTEGQGTASSNSPRPKPTPSDTPSKTPTKTQSKPPKTVPSQTPARALRDYYALLPGNTLAGYSRLTPKYKRTTSGSYSSYRAFWSGFRAVRLSGVSGSGGNQVVARLTYVKTNGAVSRERRSFQLVKGSGGHWLIDESHII